MIDPIRPIIFDYIIWTFSIPLILEAHWLNEGVNRQGQEASNYVSYSRLSIGVGSLSRLGGTEPCFRSPTWGRGCPLHLWKILGYLRVVRCNLVQHFGQILRKNTANFWHFLYKRQIRGFWPWILGGGEAYFSPPPAAKGGVWWLQMEKQTML